MDVVKQGLDCGGFFRRSGRRFSVVCDHIFYVVRGLDWPRSCFRKSRFQKNQWGFQNLLESFQNLRKWAEFPNKWLAFRGFHRIIFDSLLPVKICIVCHEEESVHRHRIV